MYSKIKAINSIVKKYLLNNKINKYDYTIDDCIQILNSPNIKNYFNTIFEKTKIIDEKDLSFCEDIVIDLIKIYFENNSKIINETEYDIDYNDKNAFSSSFKIYLNDLNKYKLLPKDKERDLLIDYKINNNSNSKDIIIYSNQKLILKYVFKKTSDENLMLDLIQEGNLALIEALEKYDLSYSCRFSTYAYWYIKRNIDLAFNNNQIIIRPKDTMFLERKIKEYCDYIYMTENRKLSEEEICNKFNIKTKALRRILRDYSITSLNQSFGEDEEVELIQLLKDDDNFVLDLENKDVYNKVIKELYNIISSDSVEMLKRRYQIDSGEITKLEIIAKEFGISTKAVSRRILNSKEKIKNNKKIRKLIYENVEKN